MKGDFFINKSNKRLIIAEIIGFFVVSILAVLFHFLFELTSNNRFVGLFSATSESVFEHTKILFFPFLLFSIIEFFFVKIDKKQYFSAKMLISMGLPLMVIIGFYTYTGIIGHNISLVDILSAFLYVLLSFIASYKLLSKQITLPFFPILIVFIFFTAGIFYLSIMPPNLPLFLSA